MKCFGNRGSTVLQSNKLVFASRDRVNKGKLESGGNVERRENKD
jgi:hypothetical protein